MEFSRRTGVTESTSSHCFKIESVKQSQIKSNNAKSFASLSVRHPRLSVRKLTCKLNKDGSIVLTQAVMQEMTWCGLSARLLKDSVAYTSP